MGAFLLSQFMKNYTLQQQAKTLFLDTGTPIGLYLRLRDRFPYSCLFEHSDYNSREQDVSIIALDPIAGFQLKENQAASSFPEGKTEERTLEKEEKGTTALQYFCDRFQYVESENGNTTLQGVYGFMAYDLVQQLEEIPIPEEEDSLPLLSYQLFRYQLVINHTKNESILYETHLAEEEPLGFETVENLLVSNHKPSYPFHLLNGENCNINDTDFLNILEKGREHCLKGDVFQIVLSRRYSQAFVGDDFNVYRALRYVNPSPYLFYFDFGDYKIFGSSPESQLVIQNQKATIHPIAGTFRSTGKRKEDELLAKELAADPKENAEHTMLVDLARNDLSVFGEKVEIENFKEIQYYSHVIHLVSKVSAQLQEGKSTEVIASTFPAGTLSGAPKVRAMQLINKYENNRRGAYGGAIGFLGFDGSFNHAIIIRSFMSKQNKLYYQAGAGVVAKSKPQSELQEVDNKLAALKKALKTATLIA